MSFPSTVPGTAPLGYMGTKVSRPIALVDQTRNPNASDARNYDPGTIWINRGTNQAFILTSKPGNVAVWTTISPSGGNSTLWSVIAVNTAGVVNNGYIANAAGNIQVLLPVMSNVGDLLEIGRNIGGGSWTITQSAGQQILTANTFTTIGAGGSLSSTNPGDAVKIVCAIPNLTWVMVSSVGNLTAV